MVQAHPYRERGYLSEINLTPAVCDGVEVYNACNPDYQNSLGYEYAVDVYPMYGSDAEASLRAGNDLRHGLIGAGVYASHGYERSHKDGAENTLKLLIAYLLQ